jgi:hypothetical protein
MARLDTTADATTDARWRARFDERYGTGAYDRLLGDLRQPCVTFATIGQRLGVTRERVRQWQQLISPDAPRGRDRRRLCAAIAHRRRLLGDSRFRRFYQHARAHVAPGRIALIKTEDGYRRRTVRIDGQTIALKAAHLDSVAVSRDGIPSYRLFGHRGAASFIFYELAAQEYLLVPAGDVPKSGARFVDRPGARYRDRKNSFAALSCR